MTVIFAFVIALLVPAGAAAQTYTCVRSGQATTAAAPGILDLSCTEVVDTATSEYDFRVTAESSSTYYARFDVVALSRPFGAVVIDARVECNDGTYYDSPESISTTDPLAVGQAGGEIAVDIGECGSTGWEQLALTPRFPEWRCDGCGVYVPADRDQAAVSAR